MVLTYFKVLFWHLPVRLRKITKFQSLQLVAQPKFKQSNSWIEV